MYVCVYSVCISVCVSVSLDFIFFAFLSLFLSFPFCLSLSFSLMSLDVAYCIVPWYHAGMMFVDVMIYEIQPLVHFCDLWPSPLTFIVCQGHFHFNHQMDVMLLCIGSKSKVCRFNRF